MPPQCKGAPKTGGPHLSDQIHRPKVGPAKEPAQLAFCSCRPFPIRCFTSSTMKMLSFPHGRSLNAGNSLVYCCRPWRLHCRSHLKSCKGVSPKRKSFWAGTVDRSAELRGQTKLRSGIQPQGTWPLMNINKVLPWNDFYSS